MTPRTSFNVVAGSQSAMVIGVQFRFDPLKHPEVRLYRRAHAVKPAVVDADVYSRDRRFSLLHVSICCTEHDQPRYRKLEN